MSDYSLTARVLRLLFPIVFACVYGCNDKGNAEQRFRHDAAYSRKDVYDTIKLDGGLRVPHGLVASYGRKGDLLERGHFDRGKRDGLWLYYDERGMVETAEVWREDRLISTVGARRLDRSGYGFANASVTSYDVQIVLEKLRGLKVGQLVVTLTYTLVFLPVRSEAGHHTTPQRPFFTCVIRHVFASVLRLYASLGRSGVASNRVLEQWVLCALAKARVTPVVVDVMIDHVQYRE